MNPIAKKAALFSGTCMVLVYLLTQQADAQITMFRGSADHNYAVNSNAATPFSETAWKFNAVAPVRSTVAVWGNALFFGSSKGLFYSLNKFTGKVNWVYNSGSAINSSAAADNGNVFFSDNKQMLYSLNAMTGKVNWKTGLGQSKSYDWAFDYFYSSPAIVNHQVFIGSKDGCLYNINEATGHISWKFKTGGIVRSSPAIAGGVVYVGDTDGSLFAINAKSGKQIWRFLTTGHGLKNENFGFDRRAIIAAPVVAGNKIIVGARDGFLYAMDKSKGRELWRVDHEVSWVMSAAAIKGNILITGTSDGHFVQAIDINSGKQLWKYITSYVVWSSPIIDGNKVYACNSKGTLYCLDLKTGTKMETYQTDGAIFSSPVISGNLLYFGCDDGYVYALKPGNSTHTSPVKAKKYVFWQPGNYYFRYGTDIRIKQYLIENGYTLLDKDKLITFFGKTDEAPNSVVVFATDILPSAITDGMQQSLLRKYLGAGGKVVVAGINPVIIKMDPNDKSASFRSFLFADSVLSIKYGPDDLRSYKGNQPAFPTKAGEEWGLNGFWTSPLSLPTDQVDIVLGKDENGLASAWVKKFNPAKGSGFVQVWIMENTTNLGFLSKVAEWGLR